MSATLLHESLSLSPSHVSTVLYKYTCNRPDFDDMCACRKINLLCITVAGFLMGITGIVLYSLKNIVAVNVRFFLPIPPLAVAAYVFVFNMFKQYSGTLPSSACRTMHRVSLVSSRSFGCLFLSISLSVCRVRIGSLSIARYVSICLSIYFVILGLSVSYVFRQCVHVLVCVRAAPRSLSARCRSCVRCAATRCVVCAVSVCGSMSVLVSLHVCLLFVHGFVCLSLFMHRTL